MKQLDLFNVKYTYSHLKMRVKDKPKKPKYDKYKSHHRWTSNKINHFDMSYSDLSRGF